MIRATLAVRTLRTRLPERPEPRQQRQTEVAAWVSNLVLIPILLPLLVRGRTPAATEGTGT